MRNQPNLMGGRDEQFIRRFRRMKCCVPALLCALGFLAFTTAPALAAAPETPEEVTVSPVKATEVTFHGFLNPAASEPVAAGTYEFLYKKSATECKGGSKAPAGSPAISKGNPHEEVSETVTGLEAGKTYTVCLLARNGTKVGENEAVSLPMTFTTATPAEKPETKPATGETVTTATLHGVLNPKAEAETGSYFAYSTGAKCTSGGTGGGETEHVAPAKVKALAVEKEVTGLEPNKAYKFCLVATNTAEEATVGNEVSLKTLALPPAIASAAASGVNSTAATLEAQVNPENETTSDVFEYATSEAAVLAGTGTKDAGAALSGYPEQLASVAVSGLKAGETYFYRVVAENKKSEEEHKPVVFPIGSVQSFTTVPTPTTEAVTAFTATTATFDGHLKPLNPTIATQYHFNYNLGGGACTGESATATGEAGTGAGTEVAETADVTELQPDAQYTVCFVTTNASGSVEGAPVHFTTSPVPPKILSESVSGVSTSEATLEAVINPNNQEVTYAFQYATNPQLTGATTVAGAGPLSGFGEQPVSTALTGLSVGETYYYRVVLENTTTHEVLDGAVKSLTPVGVPLLSGVEAQSVTATSATLTGTVNPAGAETFYDFEYITQKGYEEGREKNPADPFALAKRTSSESLPAGYEAVPVKFSVTELAPGTTYEIELIAENTTGTTTGSMVPFTTEPGPPQPTPPAEPEAVNPSPGPSPFTATTLPAVIPFQTIAELNAKEAKEDKGIPSIAGPTPKKAKCAKGKKRSHGKCVRVKARKKGKGKG